MKNNRIIVLLKGLNKREFGRFLLYIDSPFFNQNSKLIKLVKYLEPLYPDFPIKKIQKEALFEHLYGKTIPFETQKVHDHLSQLLRLFEGFITQEKIREDTVTRELFLLDGLREKGMDKQFQRVYKRLEGRLEKEKNMDSSFFLHQYQMLERKAEFHDQRQKRGKHQEFSQILISLKSHYLGASLQYACEILNRSGIAKREMEVNQQFIKEIKNELEKEGNPYLKNPNISIYYKILLNLQEPEEISHYDDLKKLLTRYSASFDKSEAKVMYAYAQNYCIRQANRGNAQFYQELFELYQGLLENGLLNTDSEELPHEHYKNITTLGLMLKKYDWVEHFLEEYKTRLHDSVQENAHSYNLANYYYETDQHQKAMRLLQQVEFTDVYYNVSARAILLRIFFESRDFESIKYVSQAFQAYLKRNKAIPNMQYKRYSNFLLLLKKMVRIHDKKHRLSKVELLEEIEVLEGELTKLKQVSFGSWIRSQIKEMSDSHA